MMTLPPLMGLLFPLWKRGQGGFKRIFVGSNPPHSSFAKGGGLTAKVLNRVILYLKICEG